MQRTIVASAFALMMLGVGAPQVFAASTLTAVERTYVKAPDAPEEQLPAQADAKSMGCLTCHEGTDNKTMHENPGVVLGCTDCHGGDANVVKPVGLVYEDQAYVDAMEASHVLPTYPDAWNYPSSANPERTYTLLNAEAPEFIRFMNPSDYRVVREACGACHMPVIGAAERSLMATGAMLWGGASYNNGILPFKRYIIGESYTREGLPGRLDSPPIDPELAAEKNLITTLYPLPAWETVPSADPFRVFERGGRNINSIFPEIGLPNALGQLQRLEEPGRPDIRQSNRGNGTGVRVSIPVLNIHKTRLNDPLTWFMGTNDQPGDYRNSGCASCHVVYANDRDPRHSGPYAQYGHTGKTITGDPTISKEEEGHPLKHVFTRAIPTSQCMICHMHQPNMFMNTMLGYTMWDYESDAPLMFPETDQELTLTEQRETLDRNPEMAVIKGKWADREFLDNVWTDVNPEAEHTQFADYHGHGWNFRAVFKRDRKGNLLDAEGEVVPNDAEDKFDRAVHMSSIHVDVGMHCVDCHFTQDGHGNGYIQGEVADAVEIGCKDCHGTASAYPTLRTSSPAAPPRGTDLTKIRNPDGRLRFEWVGEKLFQRSILNPGMEWEMSLVKDTVNPDHPGYNDKASRAKLMSTGTDFEWGTGIDTAELAHNDDEMSCYACHTSWTTSCGGCHLPVEANWKTERHHYEGGETRNWASYNPQVARDQMFQLGKHTDSKDNLIVPVRSSSALILSSTNINRERIYVQQPPVSSSGYSSQAFAPHYPHTERKTETKTCTDCHLSEENDNNAIMAQLLLHGTNFVNFVGYNAYIGGDGGVQALNVTEWDEPQAVFGSYLHRYAYPGNFKKFIEGDRELRWLGEAGGIDSASQSGNTTSCIQLRGEYLFASEGEDGTVAYDVASIANKGVADRILEGPFSPLGQDMRVRSENATCVVLPTTQPILPEKNVGDLMRIENQEQPFHPIYNYAFITDSVEGLIATDVNTIADKEPRNNFLTRAMTWNENGVLDGAKHLTIGGHIFYIAADAGIVVVDMDDPLNPVHVITLPFENARASALQFRYLFVLDDKGMTSVDVTNMTAPVVLPESLVPMAEANRVYVARTFAYVAAGQEGIKIVDVENPELPFVYQTFTADGVIDDAKDVIVATTNATLFAYIADGVNGLKIVQLTTPDSQPNFYGFSPDPKPELIAWRKTDWPALSLSKGIDRDRAVDETGHQMAVFGRLGSRPFTRDEMEEFFLDPQGRPWFVTDEVLNADRRDLGKQAKVE